MTVGCPCPSPRLPPAGDCTWTFPGQWADSGTPDYSHFHCSSTRNWSRKPHSGHSIASGGHVAVVAGVIVAAIGVPAVAGAWTDGAVRTSMRLGEGLGGYG